MANIRSFPNNKDEFIGAEDVMRWLHGRSSGVFGADGNASVAPVLDTMAVTVSDGNGWLSNENADGIVWWINNEAETGNKLQLEVDMADAALPRIDRVVVSWQTTNYVALPEVIILKGTPHSNPVAPELTNSNVLRQISLAAIRIPAGTTALTASMITDERLDESVCGLVTCGISVDTSVMQAQWESLCAELIGKGEYSYAELLAYLSSQQAAWETFFQNIQNDTLFPIPNVGDSGKTIVVNDAGDGFAFGDAQANIPITTGVPIKAEIWIDPDDDTVEESHLTNKNNPHGVTCSQIGAVPTSRTINGKPLTGNINLTAQDLGISGNTGGTSLAYSAWRDATFNTRYTTTDDYAYAGYWKYGRLVFIDCAVRLKSSGVTAKNTGYQLVTGFPNPADPDGMPFTAIDSTSNYAYAFGGWVENGALVVYSSNVALPASCFLYLHGVYIAEE